MVSSAASCVRASRRASGRQRRAVDRHGWIRAGGTAAREPGDGIREGGSRIPACRRARLGRRASGGLPRRLFAAIVAWKPPVLAGRDEL
ncbi:hypothetical protein P355_2992 [Burkholderia cenocepacia KC-01]|nr:hypothetical protein P355_2992 [Burkholderia cenocepacia KC-01]